MHYLNQEAKQWDTKIQCTDFQCYKFNGFLNSKSDQIKEPTEPHTNSVFVQGFFFYSRSWRSWRGYKKPQTQPRPCQTQTSICRIQIFLNSALNSSRTPVCDLDVPSYLELFHYAFLHGFACTNCQEVCAESLVWNILLFFLRKRKIVPCFFFSHCRQITAGSANVSWQRRLLHLIYAWLHSLISCHKACYLFMLRKASPPPPHTFFVENSWRSDDKEHSALPCRQIYLRGGHGRGEPVSRGCIDRER